MAIARALVTRPALLFADEPTGNLDYTTGTEILDALWRSCVERGQTVVLVTHDSKAAAYADRVLVIGDGRIRDTIELGRRDIARRDAAHRAARQARAVGPATMSLTDLAFRSLRARPLRAVLSGLGVALGVAVLFAGLATNAGVEASVRSTVNDLVGRADLRVAAFGETGLIADTVAAIAGTPGVAIAAPALERRTYLGRGPRRQRGAAAAGHGPRHRPVADAPTPRPRPRRRLAAERTRRAQRPHHRAPRRTGRADRRVADLDAGRRRPGSATASSASCAGDGPLTGAFGRTVIVPLGTAQAVFGETGVTRVDIGLGPGTDRGGRLVRARERA